MKKILYLLIAATVVLSTASCNFKEKEESVYNRICSSTNMDELRSYIYNYSDDAPAEHIAKVRNMLKDLVADSTAYANIKSTSNLKEKIALETEYLEKFKNGLHREEIDSLFDVDRRTDKKNEYAYELKIKYEEFALYLRNTVYSKNGQFMYGYVFSEPNSEGKGKGAFVNEYTEEVRKFKYQILDDLDEMEIYPTDGSKSKVLDFGSGGLWADGIFYKGLYSHEAYNGVKKYM